MYMYMQSTTLVFSLSTRTSNEIYLPVDVGEGDVPVPPVNHVLPPPDPDPAPTSGSYTIYWM